MQIRAQDERCLGCHDLHVQQLCEIWSTTSRPEYKPQESASTSLMMTLRVFPKIHNTCFDILAGGKEKSEFMRQRVRCPVPPNLLCDTNLIFLIFHLQSKKRSLCTGSSQKQAPWRVVTTHFTCSSTGMRQASLLFCG